MDAKFIIGEAEGVTKMMDALWIKFKDSECYNNEEFRNYLMWVEHDINKHVFRIKHNAGYFDK